MKFNIEYHVFQQDAVEKMLHPIVMGICSHGLDTGRTIIFCRTYLDTLEIFKALICMLGRCNALYLVPVCNTKRHQHCHWIGLFGDFHNGNFEHYQIRSSTGSTATENSTEVEHSFKENGLFYSRASLQLFIIVSETRSVLSSCPQPTLDMMTLAVKGFIMTSGSCYWC